MSWSSRTRGRAPGFQPWIMCGEEHCVEQVGKSMSWACWRCFKCFCWHHRYEVTIDGERKKLCGKCAAELGVKVGCEDETTAPEPEV